MNITFKQLYCFECGVQHDLEIVRKANGQDREICHGETWHPARLPTHYTRHVGAGYYEAVELRGLPDYNYVRG